MPWPRREAVNAALSRIESEARPLRVLVFGQGICSEDKPYFQDFEKRLNIAARIEDLGHVARLPETEVDPPTPADRDFLRREVEIAKAYDLCVALQPLDTAIGAPTLKAELMDLAAEDSTRLKVWLFRPDMYSYDAFEAIASRLIDSQVLSYRADAYMRCEEITDMLEWVLRVVSLPTDP